MFASVLSYFEHISLLQASSELAKSLFVKALLLALANQILPVYLYLKWSRVS